MKTTHVGRTSDVVSDVGSIPTTSTMLASSRASVMIRKALPSRKAKRQFRFAWADGVLLNKSNAEQSDISIEWNKHTHQSG